VDASVGVDVGVGVSVGVDVNGSSGVAVHTGCGLGVFVDFCCASSCAALATGSSSIPGRSKPITSRNQ
jgi:hypothetical protein